MRDAPADFERLPAGDAVFLDLEELDAPMHVGAVAILDARPLLGADERLPIERLEDLLASRLHLLPRYRKRLAWTPLTGHPVWIDDDRFDVRNHLRHVALPRRGGRVALQKIVGDFFSQKLDRGRPLWEILLVEGFEEGRLAGLVKAHHALMDGVSGVDFLILLLSPQPSDETAPARPWRPAPPPTRAELLAAELRQRAELGFGWLRSARAALRDPARAAGAVRDYVGGVASLGPMLLPGSPTPFNRPVGPNRHVRTLRVPLDEVKRLRRTYGGTVNDLVVALAAGALRRLLVARGVDAGRLDLRATIPISTRSDAERGTMGNKLAVTAVRLPVGEADPRARVRAARAAMETLKASRQALATDLVAHLAEWTSPTVLGETLKLTLGLRATHLLLTNVRGPADPFYCLRAPLLELFPVPELFRNQTLGVAVMSYAGFLHWGVTVDGSALADGEALVDCLRTEISELGKQAIADAPGEAEP
jgi:WS/DGAT/MGAT family acyltransferase